MSVLDIEPLAGKCYEVKSLIAVYRKYAESFPKSDSDAGRAGREMRIVKEQILNRLLEMRKVVNRLELEVKPSS